MCNPFRRTDLGEVKQAAPSLQYTAVETRCFQLGNRSGWAFRLHLNLLNRNALMQAVLSMFDKGMGSFRDVHSIESVGTSVYIYMGIS